ncbi:MAG: M36 family metallopeptidase [Bacteroidota bacterium]
MIKRVLAVFVSALCLSLQLQAQAPAPSAATVRPLLADYLVQHQQDWQLSDSDLNDFVVSDCYTDAKTGQTYAYLHQTVGGIRIFNAVSAASIREGRITGFGKKLYTNAAARVNSLQPTLSAAAAVQRAAAHLGKAIAGDPRELASDPAMHRHYFGASGIARRPIRVDLVFVPVKNALRLAWDVNIDLEGEAHWWNVRIDALSGDFLEKNDWTVHCDFGTPDAAQVQRQQHQHAGVQEHVATSVSTQRSSSLPVYNVLALPVEAPSFGARTLVTDPADPAASPYGWHDVDGAVGAEYTITRGNNVYAYDDINDQDVPGTSPDGGASLNFDFPINFTQQPGTYLEASVTNLFYTNNWMHDVLWHHGFDGPSGAFQENNYGTAGADGDPVMAECQDGGGTNNANFATPDDGQSGRMQMYLWSGSPDIDGSLDNGVIMHELGHGVSNRLTGGPSNTNCLFNGEQGGEGWSDYFALLFTIEPGDQGSDSRGIGTYAFDEPTTGGGIRRYPYSTDMGINPQTYGDLAGSGAVHDIGEIWCGTLWDMTWNLIDVEGFDPDWINGTGGNNIALRLVLEGMKLQPCGPGFLDGRDAILLADDNLYSGAHRCLIWNAFARRGMGASAQQGSANNTGDEVENFDLPTICLTPVAPPVANFISNVTNTCYGIVFFTDQSTDIPQSWFWDFGDGSTSTAQNPSHTYLSSGSYTVTLIVTNTLGADTLVRTNLITVAYPTSPSISGDNAICSGETTTLTASVSPSYDVTWETSGGTVVGTGTTFTTPALTATTTYRAIASTQSSVVNVGPPDASFGGGGYHATTFEGREIFTTFAPMRLRSVWVDASGTADRTINLYNQSGTILQTLTVNIPNGQSRVQVNFDIPTPGNYEIGVVAGSNLYRNNSGASYPYTIGGLVSITSSNSTTNPATYYYYLYDWEVQELPCESTPATYTISVSAGPSSNYTYSATGLTVQFTDNSGGSPVSWSWDFGDGNTSIQQNPSHTYAANGTYSAVLTVTDANGCTNTTQQSITVTSVGIADPGTANWQILQQDRTLIVRFPLSEQVQARITVLDITGRELLRSETRQHEWRVALDRFAAEVLLVRIEQGGRTEYRKLFTDRY